MARSYEQRSWCHFVSPTWAATSGEGVTRQATLEVLEHAIKGLGADPKQVYLIGYSAGGHGVWQIASLSPGLFSGVGASAGWISYFTYDIRSRPDTTDPIQAVFARALSEIDVESRFDALASIRNVGLVHGDKDHSVNVSESRRVKRELERRDVTPFYFEQPGGDHSWATATADQVDFPPLLEYLRKNARPGTGDIWSVSRLPRTWHDLLKRPLVAVYGTNGTDEENDAARTGAIMQMERCRIAYALDCDVMPDTTPLAELRGKSVILYGSPSSNRFWAEHPTGKALLETPAAQKATSWLILGERDGALWGAVGGKTVLDCRIVYAIDPTSSLYPVPDWVLLTCDVLDKDFQGVLGAGWFDRDGKIDSGHSAWR
jgi:dienelactone hydrolase